MSATDFVIELPCSARSTKLDNLFGMDPQLDKCPGHC